MTDTATDALGDVLRALDRAALLPMLPPEHRKVLTAPMALAAAGARLTREQEVTAIRALHGSADVLAGPLDHMGLTLPALPEPVAAARNPRADSVTTRPKVLVGADGRILVDNPFELRETIKALPGAELAPVAMRKGGVVAGKDPATGRPRRVYPNWILPGTPAAAATLVYALAPYNPMVAPKVRALADAHHARKAAREQILADGAPLPEVDPADYGVSADLWDHQQRMVAFGESSPALLAAIKMGGGKTLGLVALVNKINAHTVLIVAPNRVRAVWPREVRERSVAHWHIEDGTRPAMRKGGRPQDMRLAERLARAQFLWNDCDCGAPVHAFVLNYEAMVSPEWQQWVPARKLDLIAYDEGHRLKQPNLKPRSPAKRKGRHERALGPEATDAQRREAKRLDDMGPAEAALRAECVHGDPERAALAIARGKDKVTKAAQEEERAKRLTVSGLASRWVEFSERRVALSGTPFPQHPWDIFGLMRALDPGVFGLLFEPFKKRYLQMNATGQFPVRVLDAMLPEFAAKATSLMYRPAVDLKLPPVQDVQRVVELEPEAREAYDEFEAELITDLRRFLTGDAEDVAGVEADPDARSGGDYQGTTTLSERNILTRLLRLQQLTGGTLRTDDSTAANGRLIPGAEVRISSVKEDQLAELDKIPKPRKGGPTHTLTGGDLYDVGCVPGRTDADGKEIPPEPVVVFCRFRSDLQVVQDIARRVGLRYGEVSGRSNGNTGLDNDARMNPDIDVCAVQIASGGTGVDLTRAAVGIWYSLGYSVSDYDQARARLHRPGQTRPVLYLHYIAKGTKDEAVYEAIRMRRAAVSSVLRAADIDPASLGVAESDPGPDPNAAGDGQITGSAVPLPWDERKTGGR